MSPPAEQREGLTVDLQRVVLGKQEVLRDAHFRCSPGTHTAILGPNGAGKTTLLRALVGLLPYEGEARFDGVQLNRMTRVERARHVAYVPQRSMLSAALVVEHVVMQGRYAHQDTLGRITRADREAVTLAMQRTDTERLKTRPYPLLSGGEQRRVMLARALATEADVIALDEPTASLDIAHQLEFFETLRALTQDGRTIITVLHDLRDAEHWCDRAIVLHEGTVAYQGSATLPQELIHRVYGVRVVPAACSGFELLKGPR